MRTYRELRETLANMEAALTATRDHQAAVDRRLERRAQSATIELRPKVRQFGQGSTTWSPADECEYQRQLASLRSVHSGETDGLARKAARQAAAILAFRRRHGFNEPPGGERQGAGGAPAE
jgi:hypothetical protein